MKKDGDSCVREHMSLTTIVHGLAMSKAGDSCVFELPTNHELTNHTGIHTWVGRGGTFSSPAGPNTLIAVGVTDSRGTVPAVEMKRTTVCERNLWNFTD